MNLSESAADTVDYKAVRKDIADAIEEEFERRGDGTSMGGEREMRRCGGAHDCCC